MTAPASRRKGKSAAETGPEAHDLATRPKDFLTKGEVKALLAAAKHGRHGARDHLLLTMIFQHALRAIEACRLRVDQVDLEAARVWVERVKGGQSTHQPLTGDEVRMIRAYLRERKFDTPWLFAGERGDQLSRHAVQYIVRQAATRAKLSAHPHTLRHSCGYYLADRGTDFRTMQDYMGHKNPRHTAHYTRISGRKFVGLFK